jgi:hypothetical protein
MWKFLVSCELIGDGAELLTLPEDGSWKPSDAERVYRAAADAGLYITNLVKACRTTSAMPTMTYARGWLKLLRDELAMVRPRYIATMGGLVTSLMLSKPVRMADVYQHLGATRTPLELTYHHPGCNYRSTDGDGSTIVPSYFPCGRGEPAKAREILIALARSAEKIKLDSPSDSMYLMVTAVVRFSWSIHQAECASPEA